MWTLRKAQERGQADHGWLYAQHSFSFAEYRDPAYMGFGPLRVINEDRIDPGRGFGMHGHRDMEIVTYVLEGALAHKDSLGHASTILPGDVQRMSAGRGILHSEFNPSVREPLRLLQIWILPRQEGLDPGYEQKHFTDEDKRGRLRVVASPDGREGSVTIQADASIHVGLFDGQERADWSIVPGRKVYVQVARGRIVAQGQVLEQGDAIRLEDEPLLTLERGEQAEVLVFDLGA